MKKLLLLFLGITLLAVSAFTAITYYNSLKYHNERIGYINEYNSVNDIDTEFDSDDREDEAYEDGPGEPEPEEPTGEVTTRWVYEKSDLYGGYERRGEVDIPAGELESLFKNVTFEIFRNMVCYHRRDCSYFEEEEFSLESFFLPN
ncbi:MAG: hypothetical protein LIP01_06210 [Tannerellaceae bacterium]|nr:hypothetical protein [Tannerellaceae bacterium]